MKSSINKRQTAELDEWLKSGKLVLSLRKNVDDDLKEVEMTVFIFYSRSHGNYLCRKKQSVLTVLCRLYNYYWAKRTAA